MNFEFMTIDTPLPPCMPFPRALTGFPVSSTAKVMYCRMLDAMLSKEQEDENGILLFFVKYFSLKKASEFPFFSKGFSLPSAGIMHPCA